MLNKIGTKKFGEDVVGYNIKVFNEREVRAAAGILFLFATIAFYNALLVGNFQFLRTFVVAFLIDFFIRIFVGPKYSPSMVMGRIFVRNQKPEYTGAQQKKFAWILGLVLASTMFTLLFIFNVRGIVNLIVCLVCLTLLFFESVFGICFGCMLYSKFSKNQPELCPGNVCEVRVKEEIQIINKVQIITLIVFLFFVFMFFNILSNVQM